MKKLTLPDPTNPNWHKRPKTWTPSRFWRLLALRDQGLSDAEIGHRLGVSADAVKLTRRRYGVRGITAPDQPASCRAVARRMGVDCRTVRLWLQHGYLHGERGAPIGRHPLWRITEDDVTTFLANPDHWQRWEPQRITDPHLRRWAADVRRGVRFLTVGEVADRMCVSVNTVNQWIHKGYLPAQRHDNWRVREDVLARFELPRLGGQRRKEAA